MEASEQRLQLASAQLHRIADVLDSPAEPGAILKCAPPGSRPRLRGRMELRRVSFRYDPYSPDVLSYVSLTVEPGSRIAIVGVRLLPETAAWAGALRPGILELDPWLAPTRDAG